MPERERFLFFDLYCHRPMDYRPTLWSSLRWRCYNVKDDEQDFSTVCGLFFKKNFFLDPNLINLIRFFCTR